jgi:PAS domain S-box-containing protein
MYCVARNATEKKLAEKKVEEAERQKIESRVLFELFMKNSPLVAWITDIEGVMHYMNPIYLETYGFSENDCGKSIFELFKPEEANDYFQNNIQVIYGGKAIGTLEPAHKADGSKQTLNVVKFPIYHSNVVMCGGWAIDITEQKNLQQELEASNSHKDKLLSVIAHDLRNPLSGCVSLLDIILSNYDAYSREELYQDLQLIQKQSSNSFNLLEELLLWARNQLNKVDYRPEQVDFEKEIKQTLELLHQQLTEKQISVNFDFKSFETIFCDANMFRTIVRNLVSNAIKFSPAGSCISIHAVQKADDIEFSIIDQGSGIDQNILNNILKGKSNHSTFGTKGEKGSGLGLHITKDFIERNGGKLWAVSALGSGSTFFFNLPIFDHSKSNIYFSKEITI